MVFLKNLFGKHVEAEEKSNQEPQSTPSEPEKKAITRDQIVDSIDSCKAALINCGLSKEETEKYSIALTAMQQAVSGLHPNLDVFDLYEYLYQVFSSSLALIFSGGTPLDKDRAVKTINESIKAIPSTTESPIQIATLQLAVLTQNALIINSRRMIDDLNIEKAEYQNAEKELLRNSKVEDASGMSESEKLTFDQYEQQIMEISEQIRSAERLIATYNQEIVSLKGIIRSVQLNPSAANMVSLQEQLRDLRAKLPGLAEFAAMVEKATRNSEQIRAETKATIRELSRKLDDTAFIPDLETEEKMSRLLEEVREPNLSAERETLKEDDVSTGTESNERRKKSQTIDTILN